MHNLFWLRFYFLLYILLCPCRYFCDIFPLFVLIFSSVPLWVTNFVSKVIWRPQRSLGINVMKKVFKNGQFVSHEISKRPLSHKCDLEISVKIILSTITSNFTGWIPTKSLHAFTYENILCGCHIYPKGVGNFTSSISFHLHGIKQKVNEMLFDSNPISRCLTVEPWQRRKEDSWCTRSNKFYQIGWAN